MNIKKKLLSVLLCVSLIFSSVAIGININLFSLNVGAVSADDIEFVVENGQAIITGFSSKETGDLVIPDELDGYPVTRIKTNAFNHVYFNSVSIPASVTNIEERAFILCYNLNNFYVDENNQYYSGDEYGVLFNKNKTQLINYPDNNSRTSYSIPDSVETILTNSFYDTTYLKTVTVGKNVRTIGTEAFHLCSNLYTVYLPENLETIGAQAFYSCIALDNISLPNSLRTIGSGAFRECRNLSGIAIPEGITEIQTNTFSNCVNLSYLTLPNSLATIKEEAFSGCEKLTQVNIPKNVTNIDKSAFLLCSGIESFNVDNLNKNYSNDENGVLYNKDKSQLIMYSFGNKRTSFSVPEYVNEIGEYSFHSSYNLENIEIPDTVNKIGRNAFARCENLKTVNIPNGITDIELDTFFFCKSIPKISIPESVSHIDNSAFLYCDSVTEFIVDENNEYYINDKNGVLYNKEKTKLIAYPSGNERALFSVPSSVKEIGYEAFTNCMNIQKLIIPGSVINIITLRDLSNLNEIVFSEGITKINLDSFENCYNLKTIHIPTSVTNIQGDRFYTRPEAEVYLKNICICSCSEECYAKNYAATNGLNFKVCDNHSYHLSVYSDDSDYQNNLMSEQIDAYGSFNLSKLTVPQKDGYTFINWKEIKTGEIYELTDEIEILEDISVVGQWNKSSVLITFDPNGGYCPDETKSVEYGALFGNLPVPVKYGYHFDGWYIGDKKITDTDVVTGSATLLAKWKNAIYPQKYDFNSQKWTFKNRYERIPEEVFVNAYGETIGLALYNVLGNLEIGHCYGMSLSTGYILNDDMDFSVENEKLINYGQVYQYCPNAILNTKPINENTVDDFVKAVKDYVNGVDYPVAVGFYSESSGHEVLAVGIEETNDDYLIYVDDSENRNTLGTITLKKSGTEWSYNINKDYSSSKGYFLDYSTDTIEFSSMKDYYFAVKYEFVSAPGSWKNKRTNSIIKVNNRAGDSSQINNVFWNLAGEKIEMENTDNESGELIVCGQTNQIKAVVEENGEISVQTQNDGKDSNIELKGTDKFEITYSSVTESGNDTEITFSGTIAEDGISLNQEVNNFNIDGCSNCAIEITKNDEILLRENFDNVSESLNLSVDVGEDIPKISIVGAKNNVSVGYKSTVILHRSEIVSSEYDAYWYVNGKCKGNEKDLIVNEVTEDLTVELCVTDKEGNVLTKSQTQHIKVKKTFFDKLIWFFKHLFGINTVLDQK